MSPGVCSFLFITALIIQLVTLFNAQNVIFTSKGGCQVNFPIDTKLLLVLSDFCKPTCPFIFKEPDLFLLWAYNLKAIKPHNIKSQCVHAHACVIGARNDTHATVRIDVQYIARESPALLWNVFHIC